MKKRKNQKLVSFLLVVVMAFSLVACSSKKSEEEISSNDTETTVTEAAKDNETETDTEVKEDAEVVPGYLNWEEEVALSWYVYPSWYRIADTNNEVYQKILADTGVKMDIIVPAGDETEKINTLIASDALPDIVTLAVGSSQISDIIASDMVYPLDELANEYDMWFWNVADKSKLDWYTNPDGHVYQYPNSSLSFSDYENYEIGSNETFLVRKDIYEAIGSPDMSTQEGFIAAIKAAKEKYPDIIPFGTTEFTTGGCVSLDGNLQDFLAIPFEVDGKAHSRGEDPEYVSWLKAFRELGAGGYLEDSIFIDQRPQIEEKVAQASYFSMMFQWSDIQNAQKKLYETAQETGIDSYYIAVDGPANSKGDDPVFYSAGLSGWTVTLISKQCKDPERAIQLMSYMISEEGSKLLYLGVEGSGWEYNEEGKEVRTAEADALLTKDSNAFFDKYGGRQYWMLRDAGRELKWADYVGDALIQLKEWSYPYTKNGTIYKYSLDGDSEEFEINTKASALWGQTLPKLLLAATPEKFDEIWADYDKKIKEFGYDKVIAENTRQLQENKKKLGLE
jgi:putative aldouronate transport system substrate-binding protein